MNDWTQLIQPELLAMVPALNFAGLLLKKNGAKPARIPALLGGGGMVLGLCYQLANQPLPAGRRCWGRSFPGSPRG